MATLTKEQIAMKKRQLIQLQEELKAVGAWPLEDDDLINVSGGIRNPVITSLPYFMRQLLSFS